MNICLACFVTVKSELFSCNSSQALLAGLSDSQFSGSNFYNSMTSFEQSRLNGPNAWASAVVDSTQHLQADLGEMKIIAKFATQGTGHTSSEWVTSYKFGYSIDGVTYSMVKDGYLDKVFTGNTDSDTVVEHTFDNVIVASYVRVYPRTWQGHISLRWEVYECRSTGKHKY